MTPHCASDIQADEGLRMHAYQDTLGVWTIGYGHAGASPGETWTQAEAERQFAVDEGGVIAELDRLIPWWHSLSDPRQDVLVNMGFQLGVRGLLAFRSALGDIRAGHYASAAQDMLSSVWARQTPARAKRLAQQMKTGVRFA